MLPLPTSGYNHYIPCIHSVYELTVRKKNHIKNYNFKILIKYFSRRPVLTFYLLYIDIIYLIYLLLHYLELKHDLQSPINSRMDKVT